MPEPPKQPKPIEEKLNTTTTSQPKHQLSKTHLITLFETRKIRSAKQYITELKNSNPRAEKAIKESLEEIFCMKKVPSATAYMYALVFYKNLLISGEMDYYEDEEFFSHKIHEAVAEVCEYNPEEKDAKERGADYFSYAVKIEQKENEDLEATGKAVVVFSLELLQTMGELYKESYLTGEESFFLQKYNELLKKGVTFPKKEEYLYIKEQDVKEFEENYKKLLEAGEEYEEEVIEKEKKNQEVVKKLEGDKMENISAIVENKKVEEKKAEKSSVPEKVPVTQRNEKKPEEIQKSKDIIKQPINTIPKEETEIKNLTENNVNNKANESIKQPEKPTLPITQTNKIEEKPLSAGVAEILKQVQEKKKLEEKIIQQNHQENNEQSKKEEQKSTVRNEKSEQKEKEKHNKPSGETIEIVQKTKQQEVIANIDQKETSRKDMKLSGNKSKIEQKEIYTEIPNSKNIIKNKTNEQKIEPKIGIKTENLPEKESINDQKEISSFLNKKSFKRTEIPNNDKRTPEKSMDLGRFEHVDSLAIESKSKEINLEKNYMKHKHRIFEQVKEKAPKNDVVSTEKVKENVNIFAQKANQEQPKVSDSIVSFSPNPIQGIINNFRPPSPRSHKKSVPKTEKKQLEKTFCDNFEELAFKLNSTQKSFGNNNKKSFDKFPTKTLSAWRCEKHVRKEYEPSMSQQEMLEQLWSNVRSKRIPFVPEYFRPTTLKMSALRRAALELCQITSSSEIFFNNNIISARLMKPSENYFILSLANVSEKDMIIRVYDKKVKENTFEQQIKFVDENDKKKRLLRESGFMDVRFVFSTNDLNFKFLTVDFEIDEKILTLQLPVTLLDSCKVMKSVDTNEVSSLIRRSARIFISEPFSLNPKDLPKFLSTETLETTNIHIQSSQLPTTYFSIKLISASNNEKSSEQSILLYRINEVLNLKGRYELSILLESNNGETENFAKVMMELLLFLLEE